MRIYSHIHYCGLTHKIYGVREHYLTHPMLPERMRHVTQALVWSIGGMAWINIRPEWLR